MPQLVGDAGHERRLRPDDHEVGAEGAREVEQRLPVLAREPDDTWPCARDPRDCPARRGARQRDAACDSFHASACSRPPDPTRSTFTRPSLRQAPRTASRRISEARARTRARRRCRRARRERRAPPRRTDVVARRSGQARHRRARSPQPGASPTRGGSGGSPIWCAGKSSVSRAVRQLVADADRQLGEGREHVELRQRQRRDPVHANGEAERDEVEPAAPPLPAGDRAELAAELAHALLVAPSISLGNGPSPTRVTYALATPTTSSIRFGPIPKLTAAPAAIGLDEVTNGYVPWSRSRSVALRALEQHPLPSCSARSTSRDVSATYGRSRCAYRVDAPRPPRASNGSRP